MFCEIEFQVMTKEGFSVFGDLVHFESTINQTEINTTRRVGEERGETENDRTSRVFRSEGEIIKINRKRKVNQDEFKQNFTGNKLNIKCLRFCVCCVLDGFAIKDIIGDLIGEKGAAKPDVNHNCN